MTKEALEQLAATLGGLSILGCLPGSPSAEAGLRYGDVLLEVNGQPTPDVGAYVQAIRERNIEMRLRVFRDGQELLLTLPLPAQPRPMSALRLLHAVARSGVLPASASADLPPLDEHEGDPDARA